MERTVLAIDPGTDKCGMALVRRDSQGKLHILWRAIAPSGEVPEWVTKAAEVAAFAMLVIGRGTGSRSMVELLRSKMPGQSLLLVDEANTTLQARERYWEHNPRRGWRRLLPATMQVPPEPVDDFVALILAERVLLT